MISFSTTTLPAKPATKFSHLRSIAHNIASRQLVRPRMVTKAATPTASMPSMSCAGVSLANVDASALPQPQHALLVGSEPGSFAHDTITKRLPAILSNTVRDMSGVLKDGFKGQPETLEQLAAAAASIERLREEIQANAPLTPVVLAPSGSSQAAGGSSSTSGQQQQALESVVCATNAALAVWRERTGQDTWLGLPWLLVECYMYVRIAAAVHAQPLLAAAGFDPFSFQKRSSFVRAWAGVADLADAMKPLIQSAGSASEAELKTTLLQVLRCSLWGNKTDLSLHVDAASLDTAGAAAAALLAVAPPAGGGGDGPQQHPVDPHIIVDDYEVVWTHVERRLLQTADRQHRRVDIVLDNAGLELYSDLCLADFLIEAKLADEVVLHGKPVPWFVSDTTARDLEEVLTLCEQPPSFPGGLDPVTDGFAWRPVQELAGRWRQHLATGRWRYQQHPFWTTPLPFSWMPAAAPGLHEELSGGASSLLIFKGDLNYRKLTFDCRWPSTTPFTESLVGFAPAPLLALRTLKADVVAGLKAGQAESLLGVDPQWMVNGKWGMVQAAGMA